MIFKTLEELSSLGKVIESISGVENSLSFIDDLAKATDGLSVKNTLLALSSKGLTKEQIELVFIARKVKEEEYEQALATYNLSNSQNKATLSTTNLGNAMKGLGAKAKGIGSSLLGFAKAHPILLAITAVVGVATFAFVKHKRALEDAREEISELQDEYSSGKSELESLNSELETTQTRINELKSQGKLSFTDKNELIELQKQNAELERKIQLQELANKASSSGAVAEILENEDVLNEDFDKKLSLYNELKTSFENQKISGMNLFLDGQITKDVYDNTIKQGEIDLNKSYEELLTSISEFEKNKQSILDKYNGDVSKMSEVDKNAFNTISKKLQDAYKSIYTDNEFNQIVIEPVFNTEELDGVKEKLLQYFENGGSLDETILTEQFGSTIITALKNACELAGIEFDVLLSNLFNQATNPIYGFAPIKKNVNSKYDVEANNKQQSKIDYYNSLDSDERMAVDGGEIVFTVEDSLEDCKKKVDEWKESIGSDTNQTSILSFDEAWESLSNVSDSDSAISSTREELEALANAGKLTVDAFNNTEGSTEFLDMIGLSAEEATNKVNELVNSSTQLNAMRDGIYSLSENLSTKSANPSEAIDVDVLAGMSEELKKQTSEWEKYEEVLGNSKSTYEEVKQATDDLATAFVNSNNFLAQLTEENRDYYETQLANMGVENAAAVVSQTLANKKEQLALENEYVSKTGVQLSNTTKAEIDAFAQEQGYADATKNALYRLALQKLLTNGTTLSFDADLANIATYVEALGKAASAIRALQAAKAKGAYLPTEVEDAAQSQVDAAMNPTDVKINTSQVAGNSNNTGGNNSGGGGSSSKTEIDWIAQKLERLREAIDLTKAKFENLFSLKSKSNNLDKQIKQTTKLLKAEEKAAKKYAEKANKIANKKYKSGKNKGKKILTKGLINKIQDGKIKGSINDLIKEYGETVANAIEEYKKWYNLSKENKKAIQETKAQIHQLKEEKYQLHVDDAEAKIEKTNAQIDVSNDYATQNKYLDEQEKYIKESYKYQIKIAKLNKDTTKQKQLEAELEQELLTLEKQRFDNIEADYERRISLFDHDMKDLDNKISEIEAAGATVNKTYYEAQKQTNSEIKKQYEEQKAELEKQLVNITAGTEEWYEAKNAIQECENAISDCNKKTLELNTSIRELYFKMFEDTSEGIRRIATEQELLQSLFAHEKTASSETGNYTDAGIARLGSTAASYYAIKEDNANNLAILNELKRMIDTGEKTSELLGITFDSEEQLEEAYKKYFSIVETGLKDEYNEMSKLADLVKERYQAELDMLRDLIDAKIEYLDTEKELHDYANTINDKVSNIDTLQKQISAYQGDSSQEGMARLQKLQKELTDAQKDLEETEADKAFNDQKELLENLFTEAEELIAKKLDDFYGLVDSALKTANGNLGNINSYLSAVATDFGYQIQEDGTFKLKDGEKSLADIIKNIAKGIEKDVKEDSGTKEPEPQPESNQTSSTDSSSNTSQNVTIDQNVAPGGTVVVGDKEFGTGLGLIANNQERGTDTVDSVLNNALSSLHTVAIAEPSTKTSEEKDTALDYIKGKASKPAKNKNKKTDYQAVNQKIWDLTGGKVLSVTELKELSKLLGIKYDNAKKTGNLYKKLKSIGLDGFATGGIARLLRSKGEDGIAMVRNGEGLIAPEHVPAIEELVNLVPQVNDIMQPLVKFPNVTPLRNASFGDTVVNIEMNGVNDPETFSKQLESAMRTPKVQKQLRSVTTDKLAGGSRLGINTIK